ncbi:MAG: rod shape-determining protein MreD [Sedimentisphaerales bacterium]|jgi:rod shape-determining protein MreD
MRWPIFAVLVAITALLQSSVVDAIAVTRFHVTPNLLLILMVFFAVRCDLSEAIITSFVLGFVADIAATGFPMGMRIISFGLFGTGLAYMHRVVTIRKISHEALAILAAGLGTGGLAKLLALVAGRLAEGFGSLAGTSIYSAVVGPFLFLFLDWLMGTRGRHRSKV